jgi:hypothetical protein
MNDEKWVGRTDGAPVREIDGRNGRMLVALLGVLSGAVVAAAGSGRLFVSDQEVDIWARSLLAVGTTIFTVSTIFTLRLVRELPISRDECVIYGRHIVGLTFALLVTGLCNAAGMSALALEGGLDFSAASLIDASDTNKVVQADSNRLEALNEEKSAERELRGANKALVRARAAETQACSTPPAPSTSAGDPLAPSAPADAAPSTHARHTDSCRVAREAVTSREDDLDIKSDRFTDATEHRQLTETACAEARLTKKRGLFFLLSVSTITSLFGAAFYVVNQVREKRPPITPPGSGPTNANGSPLHGSPTNGSNPVTTFTATASVDAPDDALARNGATPGDGAFARATGSKYVAAPAPATITAEMTVPLPKTAEEPFDVHKFWSGAFFRVGEAVLFTFTFFWLLWSSQSTEYAIWLPVLALFVGMFVKTGETIIFRLGMRILSAAEALLPAGGVERVATHGPAGEGVAPSGATGSVTVRDGNARARLSSE